MAAALAALFAGCAGTPCARRRQTCVRGNGTGEGSGGGHVMSVRTPRQVDKGTSNDGGVTISTANHLSAADERKRGLNGFL